MTNPTDQFLVQSFIAGDSNAFETLFDRYYKRVEYFFFRMLWNDKEKAEDFAQDLFLKVLEKLDSYKPELSFKTWLFSIANNMCKNEYRKKEVEDKSKDYFLNTSPTHVNGKTEVGIDENAFLAEMFTALEDETCEKRTAFILKHLEFLSIKEISETLNLPEGTIKSGLHYTAKKLSKKLSHFKSINYE